MLSFIRECGTSTVGSSTRLALRMRVNMSEIVSVIISPAGFGHTRDEAVQRALAEGHAGTGELAQITVAAAAHRAAVDDARRAGIARQLREAGVIALGLQFSAQRGEFLHRGNLLLVSFQPCLLGHKLSS